MLPYIYILPFGACADIFQKVTFELNGQITVNDVLQNLYIQYPELKNVPFQVAINQNIVPMDTHVQPSDELALLPPFSGG